MGTGISNHASGIPMTHLCICEAKSGHGGHEVTPDRKALKVIVSHLESYVNGKIPKGRYSKAKKVCKEVSFSPPIVDSNAGFTQFRKRQQIWNLRLCECGKIPIQEISG